MSHNSLDCFLKDPFPLSFFSLNFSSCHCFLSFSSVLKRPEPKDWHLLGMNFHQSCKGGQPTVRPSAPSPAPCMETRANLNTCCGPVKISPLGNLYPSLQPRGACSGADHFPTDVHLRSRCLISMIMQDLYYIHFDIFS